MSLCLSNAQAALGLGLILHRSRRAGLLADGRVGKVQVCTVTHLHIVVNLPDPTYLFR